MGLKGLNGQQKRAACFATLLQNELESDRKAMLRVLPATYNRSLNKSGLYKLQKVVAERRE